MSLGQSRLESVKGRRPIVRERKDMKENTNTQNLITQRTKVV